MTCWDLYLATLFIGVLVVVAAINLWPPSDTIKEDEHG